MSFLEVAIRLMQTAGTVFALSFTFGLLAQCSSKEDGDRGDKVATDVAPIIAISFIVLLLAFIAWIWAR